MASTEFFGMADDDERLVRRAFELGLKIVPDLRYDSCDVQVVTDLSSYFQMRVDTSLFFMFSEDTIASPLTTVKLHNSAKYYIKQRHGGPYITYLRYATYDENGILVIPSGSIGHYPTVYDSINGETVRPSPRFKEIYKSLDAEVKRGSEKLASHCVDGAKRWYWATPLAIEAVRSGARFGVPVSFE